MIDDEKKASEGPSASIEELLRERDRLDRDLTDRFKKEVTVLFTDIVGYTKYMDTRGDLSGRAMLQQHNDIVIPCIESHGGSVIKTIGDAVMASFSDPVSAVRAAVAIQNGLAGHNQGLDAADHIRVRIGANRGSALVDGADVYGDVVNVASRIEGQAGPGEILISESVYERVRGSDDLLCRWHGQVQVKGKAEALDLYRVVYMDESRSRDMEARVRSVEASTLEVPARMRVLQLEITRDGDQLRMSAHEGTAGEELTVRHYEDLTVSMDRVDEQCLEMVRVLNTANREGRLTREVLVRIRDVGKAFHERLLTERVKRILHDTEAEYLGLYLDDQLVHIPWELLHDGVRFLCLRFSMGRMVRTRLAVSGAGPRTLAPPLKMLVITDPEGELEEAQMESRQVLDLMARHADHVDASTGTEAITPAYVRSKIRNFDLVHFAGHAAYNADQPGESELRLRGGGLKAREIMDLGSSTVMPALFFSNACQTARTEGWGLRQDYHQEIFGLANAFLLSGVRHYVGTFWDMIDEPSRHFALSFYEHLLSGQPIGRAVRLARESLIGQYGEETVVWAGYLLYGDPTFGYTATVGEAVERPDREPAVAEPAAVTPEVVEREAAPVKRGRRLVPAVLGAIGVLAVLAVVIWAFPRLSRVDTSALEQSALAAYQQGDYKGTLETCRQIEEKNAEVRLIYLLRGDIHFRSGTLEEAERDYRRAVEATRGTIIQKAEALHGLGRIESSRSRPEAALDLYRQATELAPGRSQGYLAQAMVLERAGRGGEALKLMQKARQLSPNDRGIEAMVRVVQEKTDLARDKARRERIDKLAADLVKAAGSMPKEGRRDAWTSRPLTLWVLEIQSVGYTLREAEERLVGSELTDRVLQAGRITVVERALMDRVMEELKLGSSELADKKTALALGRLIAARLMLSGELQYGETKTTLSLRLIETETGRIAAAMSRNGAAGEPTGRLLEQLFPDLMGRITALYPLRARISMSSGSDVALNIGRLAGVLAGDRFKTPDLEAVVEVLAVEPETSLVKVVSGADQLADGVKVQRIEKAR